MYKLYDWNQTGGTSVRAALGELEVFYDLVEIDIRSGAQFTDEYTRINPRQQVPSLELPDGSILTENTAILMHLADTHPEADLAPRCGSVERAQINRWLSFFAMNNYVAETRRLRPERYTTDQSAEQGIVDAATALVKRHYDIFEGAIGDGPYFLGGRFSILDIYVWMLVQWWGDYDGMRRDHPKILRLVETVMDRPKIKPVHEAHFGPGLGIS
jgi:glutathione S-transferase